MNDFVANPRDVNNFTESTETQLPQEIRDYSEFLPSVNRSESLTRFFGSTVNQLLSSGSTQTVDAYWGRIKGKNYNAGQELFIEEADADRLNYQFQPGVVTRSSGDVTSTTSYVNSIKRLENLGADTSNHDKLFTEPGYVLDLPINIDMFVNFGNYYWLEGDIPEIEIEATVSDPINIDDIVELAQYTTPTLGNYKSVKFVSGLRVKFTGEYISSSSGNYSADVIYFVENVGEQIKLVEHIQADGTDVFPDLTPYRIGYANVWDEDPWDEVEWDGYGVFQDATLDTLAIRQDLTINKSYVVMERWAQDINPWARSNKWYSVHALREMAAFTGLELEAYLNDKTRARRPVLQYRANLELYNTCKNYAGNVNYVISIEQVSELLSGVPEFFVDDDNALSDGDIVLVARDDPGGITIASFNDDFNDDFDAGSAPGGAFSSAFATSYALGANESFFEEAFTVTGVGTTISLVPFATYNNDDFVIVTEGVSAGDVWCREDDRWFRGQNKDTRGQHPLFKLYDDQLTDLEDYPDNDFQGQKIFGYVQRDDGQFDRELGFRPGFAAGGSFSDYTFEFPLNNDRYNQKITLDTSEEIIGLYSFRDWVTNKHYNGWSLMRGAQRVPIVQTVIADGVSQPTFELGTSNISRPTEFTAIWDEPRSSYRFYDHSYIDINEIGGRNPALVWKTDTDYTINEYFDDPSTDLVFRDPYDIVDANIVTTVNPDNANQKTVNISSAYQYAHVRYERFGDPDNFGFIYLSNENQDRFTIRRNGQLLEEGTDYTRSDTTISITITANANDVFELEYIADANLENVVYDVAPVHFYNTQNEPYTGSSYSNLLGHFRAQLEALPGFTGDVRGENNYYETARIHEYGGLIRQQFFSSDKFNYLLDQEDINPLRSLLNVAQDYELFKKYFRNKVTQLWRTEGFDNVRTLVDRALEDINIGKNRDFKYAHSDMAYYRQSTDASYDISDSTLVFDMPRVRNQYGDTQNHVYVWMNQYDLDEQRFIERMLIEDIDYTIEGDKIVLTESPLFVNVLNNVINGTDNVVDGANNVVVGLGDPSPATLTIRWYSHKVSSHIPPSAVKLGFFRPTQVEIIDGEVVGHDGSRVKTVGANFVNLDAPDFDVVAAAVFELESRIYNNLVDAHFVQDDFLGFDMGTLYPSPGNEFGYSVADINEKLDDWASRYFVREGIETLETVYNSLDAFTWNYSSVAPQPELASWRNIYVFYFGTDRPHTHPWEMLGHRTKPSWWDLNYSWTDAPRRAALENALQNGITGDADGPDLIDVRYQRSYYDWSDVSAPLVDPSDGTLRDPIEAGILPEPTEIEKQQPFVFGDWSEAEDTWRKSSEYLFALADAYLQLRPYSTFETFWTLDKWMINRNFEHPQWIDHATCSRQRNIELHNQLIDNGIIESVDVLDGGIGYSSAALEFPTDGLCSENAEATVYVRGGEVTAVEIDNPGREYVRAPTNVDVIAPVSASGLDLRYNIDYDFYVTRLGFNTLIAEEWAQDTRDTTELTEILANLSLEYIMHVGGFTDKRIFNLELDGSYSNGRVTLPPENYDVVMDRNAPRRSIFFSGVELERLDNGYVKIRGYDFDQGVFTYLLPSTGGRQVKEDANDSVELTRYLNWKNEPTTLLYNTVFDRRQELYNFLLGLGEYYRSVGIHLSAEWETEARDAINWWLRSGSDFYYMNGLDDELVFEQGAFGVVRTVDINYTGQANILNQNFERIKQSELLVLRDTETTSFSTKLGDDSIYGIGIKVIDFEHMIVLQNSTDFNDVVYDPITGLGQNRIRLVGERTRNWNGRIEAPGYLVKETGIILNMESAVREVESDWINSESKTLERLTRRTMGFNVGYNKPTYLQDTFIADVSAYRFEKGERKYKGTESALEAISRSKNIFGAEFEHEMYEDWMVRLGDFGDKTERNPLQFELVSDKIKSDPQHFRFNEAFVSDAESDLIIDLHEGAPEAVSGNFNMPFTRRDVLRLDETSIAVVNNYQEFAKSAGLPLVDEIDYFIGSIDDIDSVYDPTADYAMIPSWNEASVYLRGDQVRYQGEVWQLTKESTGLNLLRDDVVIRGTQVFPIVSNDSTFIANGVTVTFEKFDSNVTFNEIVLLGSENNPTVPSGSTLVLDGVNVNFIKTENVTTYADIELDGTVIGPTLQNGASRTFTIYYANDDTTAEGDMDTVVTTFDELDPTLTFQQIWIAALTTASSTAVGSVADPSGSASARIIALEAFRTSYLAAGNTIGQWNTVMQNYYADAPNPERYVNPENIAALVAGDLAASWRSDAEALIQLDLDLIAELSGNAATETVASLVTGPVNNQAQLDLDRDETNNALDFNVSSNSENRNLQDFRTAVETTGGTSILNGRRITVTNPTEYVEDDLTAIITKINAAITAASLPSNVDIVAEPDGAGTRLRIRRFNNAVNYRLGVEADGELGYQANDRDVETQGSTSTVGVDLTLTEIVDIINAAPLPGVSAASVSSQLELRSTNQSLSIGDSAMLVLVGLSAGVYNATSNTATTPIDLAIGDVVQQINNAAIPDLVASQVQGALILTYNGDTLVIGEGTANTQLGITANTYESNIDTVSNTFNSSEWEIIVDPANFNIWVVDNIGSNPDPQAIQTDYQVYQTADFGIGIQEICVGQEIGDDAEIVCLSEHRVAQGDYVFIIGSNSVPNADGIHQVQSTPDGFRFFIDEYISEKGFTGKIIPLRKVRVSNTVEAENFLTDTRFIDDARGLPTGSYVYVDNYSVSGVPQNKGAVYQVARRSDNTSLDFVREELGKIDNSQIKNAVLYSRASDVDVNRYEVYDPLTGFIPGIAEAEIDIRSEIDIASYNNTTDPEKPLLSETAWGRNQQGLVWWDLSNAIYLDYHQGNEDYRQEHWAELFPTATIDVFEWTKSPVTPDEYETAVASGTVIDGIELSGIPYSVTDNLGETQYYWTEDIELNPNTNQLETYFYFWVKNKTTVPNFDRTFSVLQLATIIADPEDEEVKWVAATSESTLLASGLVDVIGFEELVMQINFNVSDADYHQEFILLPEADPTLLMPEWLHISLRDSLAGFTQLTATQNYVDWDAATTFQENTLVKGSNDLFYIARIDTTNNDPTTDVDQDFWYPIDVVDENPDGDYEGANTVLVDRSYNIPDLSLHPFSRLGIETRPHQTWFEDLDTARRTLIEKINSQLLPVNLIDSDIPWREEFERTVQFGAQTIDLREYWDYTAWLLPGVEEYDREVTDYELQTVAELATLTPIEGEIATIVTSTDDDGLNRLSAYICQDGQWVLFYKEKATIQFNELIWNNTLSASGWDTGPFDIEEWDKTAIVAAIEIFDSFYYKIWIEELKGNYNDLWFHMVRYVLQEQDEVDWIYKTSYVKLVFEDTLEKDYNKYFGQNADELFDYIDVVKPFRTKLRDAFTRKLADEALIADIDDTLEVRVQTNPVDSTVNETNTRSFRLTVGQNGNNYSSQIVNEHKVLLGLDIGATDTIIAYLNDGSGTLPTEPGAIWINGERIEYTAATNVANAGIGSGFSSGFSTGFGGVTLLTGCVRGTQGTFARPHSYADIIEDETNLTLTENLNLSDYANTIRPAWNELTETLLDGGNDDANAITIRAERFGTIDAYGELFAFQLLALQQPAEAIESFQQEIEELIETYWSTI